eukprot:NODE_1688_length_1083_cov_275.533074.p4 GENE.NODE_1688_length_1083_cov_275.533074~~NODE_1688_length_1083_cov_275.533074.p4  ORF type:complete len:111 (+),score=23.51 NODE_1688_length_1083_cov_275.533074:510-842(+)
MWNFSNHPRSEGLFGVMIVPIVALGGIAAIAVFSICMTSRARDGQLQILQRVEASRVEFTRAWGRRFPQVGHLELTYHGNVSNPPYFELSPSGAPPLVGAVPNQAMAGAW